MFDTLTDTQFLALSKTLASAARKRSIELPSGLHRVAPFTATVESGEVSVGEPEDYTPTVKIPLLSTMVIALHRAGFQRDGIAQIIIDSASDALNRGSKVGDELQTTISYVQQEVKSLQLTLGQGLPTATRKGKVKATLRGGCDEV